MRKGKRLLAAVLSFVLTATMGLPNVYAKEQAAGNGVTAGAAVASPVAGIEGNKKLTEVRDVVLPAGLVNNSKTDTAIRAVVDNITELPQYGVADYATAYERGTIERPFVILEIVPYEECAEFGYLVSGCEPVKIEQMYAEGCVNVIAGSADAAESTYVYVKFFMDEEVITVGYAGRSLTPDTSVNTYNGYYEYVGDGNGYLTRQTSDEDGVSVTTMVKVDSGDFIWHTIHDFENEGEYGGTLTFTDVIDAEKEYSAGERIYSTRQSGVDSPVTSVGYYYYKSNECFVRDTLGLSEEQAAQYSVVIKTITPDELNDNTEWVDYADLIYLSPANHMQSGNPDTDTRGIWKKFNRLGHNPTNTGSTYLDNQFEYNDISFDTAVKIFKKVNANTNFAAIIMDNRVYDVTSKALTSETVKQNVKRDVYDFNLNLTDIQPQAITSCKNNVYKLAVMLLSMDSNLFESIYLDGGYIVPDPSGKKILNTLQTGDAAEYWSGYSFLPVPVDREVSFPWWTYFDAKENWLRYGFAPNLSNTLFKSYVNKHVYTYDGNSCSFQSYMSARIGANDVDLYQEFIEYLKEHDPEEYEKFGKTNGNSSDAVRYILDIHSGDAYFGDGVTLKVLDIEPTVALDSNSHADWVLTESYLHMLMPHFRGDFDIVHQTTAEYVGKNEDINSEYDLIYMGLDTGGFNMSVDKKYIKLSNEAYFNDYMTDFNDNTLDGKIYFHMGDSLTGTNYVNDQKIGSTTYKRTRSVKFLYSVDTGSLVNSEELRFPGNDISRLKVSELARYIQSGKPIIAAKYLYNLEEVFIDSTSNIYSFVYTYRNTAEEVKGVFSSEDTLRIQDAVKNSQPQVTFVSWPNEYNGTTVSDTSAVIGNANYLPTYVSGNAYLAFNFNVASEGYAYRLYVDQDRDGKFSSGEVILAGDTVVGSNTCTYTLAASMVGLVQWKLEVFEKGNTEARSSLSGFSAVQVHSESEKKVINVLQILPKDGDFRGKLNLQTNDNFKKYYNNLNDFTVTVRTITWKDFEQYFYRSGFEFDMSKAISTTNPDSTALQKASDNKGYNGRTLKSELGGQMDSLNNYNMIIVGFGDGYGSTNLDDSNGAVEYLQYYTEMGKSILYTHDITSLYNLPSADGYKEPMFGYTANAMMRDLMGMNRYMAVSNQLPSSASRDMRAELIAYQNANAMYYDSINSELKHGFTYYALKRLGWTAKQTSNSNPNKGNRVPYKYMINNPEDGKPVCNDKDNREARESGFNNANDLTDTATKLNEGQITSYPYKISDTLDIASTHAQWYQLNIEDPEVTVWYCLSDPEASGKSNNRTTTKADSGNGSALTYGVSPNDASNNYYIYSKGNIFYSGVGHSTVDNDMEAKLFVNTMIAAYRRSYEAAGVEVTGVELAKEAGPNQDKTITAVLSVVGPGEYAADVPETDIPDEYSNYVRVYFKPQDMSLSNNLSVRISTYGSSDYITKIYTAEAEPGEAANTLHEAAVDDSFFAGLKNQKVYYFYYDKSKLDSGTQTILFEVMNDRSSEVGLSYLRLDLQLLFLLD